jgi:hypothetical protein
MTFKVAMLAFRKRIFLFSLMLPSLLWAQGAATILSGTVTDPSGKVVSNATVTTKSLTTGQATEAHTDSKGFYSLSNLAPGSYSVSIAAEGFALKETEVSISGSGPQSLDLRLNAAGSGQELPNAPSPAPAPPSLGDLGFSPQQTQANPQLQALLAKRTEMLRIHQRLGIITTIPMAAAIITGPMAKVKGKNGETIREPTTANLDFHAALGGTTTALYFSTAYFAIFAPKVPGATKHGAIRWHEALAFVHGPGMVLTPILGYMAYKQENAGEKVHGIASAHGTVAYITAASYGAAIVAVSWPIHLKF